MTESIHSDTTSDSEFDEHELTAEDEDEDSIAPEEDVADEEEVNSLVKVRFISDGRLPVCSAARAQLEQVNVLNFTWRDRWTLLLIVSINK